MRAKRVGSGKVMGNSARISLNAAIEAEVRIVGRIPLGSLTPCLVRLLGRYRFNRSDDVLQLGDLAQRAPGRQQTRRGASWQRPCAAS